MLLKCTIHERILEIIVSKQNDTYANLIFNYSLNSSSLNYGQGSGQQVVTAVD